jgi:hypothetical protein
MPSSTPTSVGKRRLLIALTLPVAVAGLLVGGLVSPRHGDPISYSVLFCIAYWILVGVWHWVAAGFRADKEASPKRNPGE